MPSQTRPRKNEHQQLLTGMELEHCCTNTNKNDLRAIIFKRFLKTIVLTSQNRKEDTRSEKESDLITVDI